MRDDSVGPAREEAGDEALPLVDEHRTVPVDPPMDAFELAACDEAVELTLAHPEPVSVGRRDELVVLGEVIDEVSLHASTDSDVAV